MSDQNEEIGGKLFKVRFLINFRCVLTGVSVKIGANFPDGLAPIFSKMCNMKYLHDILAYAKNFDPQSLYSPKKWPFFTLTCHFHMEI